MLKKHNLSVQNALKDKEEIKKPILTKPFKISAPAAAKSNKFKWVRPEPKFEKYGPTKIKIIADLNVYSHLRTHKLNIFFDQYNEFVKQVFKN